MSAGNGPRVDGRAYDELRPVTIETGYLETADGSVLISCGKTRVLCVATVLESVSPWLIGQGRGWVTGEYAMLPRSTQRRTPRETSGPSGRTQEIRRLIGRSLRAAVDLFALGERTVIVDCDVIQADGGTRTASITGGYVALALALKPLIDLGLLDESVLTWPVAAVSVGMIEGDPMLDLCYDEDVHAQVDMNVVMNGAGDFIEVQGTAEGQPFSRRDLDHMLALAEQGIARLLDAQRRALGRSA
ncbi:MAG TPA: ribonuclease PH [Chloroflexi bacterium]|nr:ribonuclease PH [Chloroflexota bacterium]